MEEKNTKYVFGISEEWFFPEKFDTVEELIAFAKNAYEHHDRNFWEEDGNPHCIFIGIHETIKPSYVAPSLESILLQMNIKYYENYCVKGDARLYLYNQDDANKEFEAFIDRYFSLPYKHTASWICIYDLKAGELVQIFKKKRKVRKPIILPFWVKLRDKKNMDDHA